VGDVARDLGKAPRVAERLQVEQHELGAGVAGPVLEQVIARDVGLVAERHEAGQPEPQPRGGFQDRLAEGAGLARHCDGPGRGVVGRKGGVQAHGRVGVDHPHAVWADHAHAAGAKPLAERVLEPRALLVHLLEPGGNRDQSLYALGDGFVDRGQHEVARDRDHGEVDLAGNGFEGREGGNAVDETRVWIDRIDRSLEAGAQEVGDDFVADRLGLARGADHSDRSRREQGG
jgi:hypothetical protein